MKAVFLDKGTFLDSIDLPAPQGVTDYQTFDTTPQDKSVIVERSQDADIIITNKVEFDDDILSDLPNLKLIQLTATGMNNVDKDACKAHNVELYNVAGYSKDSVAEHTFMMILSAMRAGIHYHNKVKSGDWSESGVFTLMDMPIVDIKGKTLGIIGVGTIGKQVTEIAKAFGVNVLWAEHQGKDPRSDEYTAFDEVLEKADIISIHAPLTEATKHLINKDTLAKMQNKPLVVNMARGGLVNTSDMAEAVKSEQVFGYASDVFEQEPIEKSNPLLDLAKQNHPRVLFTPHNAWGSVNAQQKLWDILCEQVSEFIKKNK